MKPTEIFCPSCGARHDIYNPGVITVVCDYCGTAVYWDEEKIETAGKQSILPEGFSRLYRGATGTLSQQRFFVLGRVRYSFGKGFWDEWYLEFNDGTLGWLIEDNHELSLETRTTSKIVRHGSSCTFYRGTTRANYKNYPEKPNRKIRDSLSPRDRERK